jgi:hypothetical protein
MLSWLWLQARFTTVLSTKAGAGRLAAAWDSSPAALRYSISILAGTQLSWYEREWSYVWL